MTKIGHDPWVFVRFLEPASRKTIVIIAFLSRALLDRCLAKAPFNGKLLTTSPLTTIKSPVIRWRLSRSRIASPTEHEVDLIISRVLKGDDGRLHFDLLTVVSHALSVWYEIEDLPDIFLYQICMRPAVNKYIFHASICQK